MQVIIEREFDAYPNGDDKQHVTYKPGDKPIEVSDALGKIIVEKGLARESSPSAQAVAAAAPATEHQE